MTPRMLVLDIDGTTLRADHALAEEDRAAIAALVDAGIPVALATGRLYSGARMVTAELGLEGRVACMNGSEIVDVASGDRHLRRALGGAALAAARDALRHATVVPFLFTSERIVHCERGEPFTAYMRTWSATFDRCAEVLEAPDWDDDDGVLAVAAISDEAGARAVAEAARDALPPEVETLLYPSRSGFWALQFRDRREDKGTALDHLAAPHGLTADHVVAVGDWLNDLPMLRRAGRSFAMGQAPREVKEAATDVLDRTSETGGAVADVARTVWGIEA
ncbi:MAG: HAD family phosphatase [Deltaproteobacteria bacterium]|nr:MAG: HAD family phosphatase [Deltaproteobacteria bacterium]